MESPYKKYVQRYYLNRERVSDLLDCHQNEIVQVANDWQDKSIIPRLENGLDLVLKQPGVHQTESINHY